MRKVFEALLFVSISICLTACQGIEFNTKNYQQTSDNSNYNVQTDYSSHTVQTQNDERLKKYHDFYNEHFTVGNSEELYFDLTHDGYDNLVVVDCGLYVEHGSEYQMHELRIYDIANGDVSLVGYEAGERGVSGDRVALKLSIYNENGKYYILRKDTGAWTGWGRYGYQIYRVDPASILYVERQEPMIFTGEMVRPVGFEEYLCDRVYDNTSDETPDKGNKLWEQFDKEYEELLTKSEALIDINRGVVYGGYSVDDLYYGQLPYVSMYEGNDDYQESPDDDSADKVITFAMNHTDINHTVYGYDCPNGWQCAEFVATCLIEGNRLQGYSASNLRFVDGLMNALEAQNNVDKIVLNMSKYGKINNSNNGGAVVPGDVIVYYCDVHKKGLHAELVTGINDSSMVVGYAHNCNLINEELQYNFYCKAMGGCESIDDCSAILYHFR